MSVIDELNTVSKNMADGPLKLTEKNNGVPTEEIWKDWEDYVVNARARYEHWMPHSRNRWRTCQIWKQQKDMYIR